MLKKLFSPVLIFAITAAMISSCGEYKSGSMGDLEKIVVFADSVLYQQVHTDLENVFDQYIYTPHTEKSYFLDRQSLENLDVYNSRRNLIFVGFLNQDDNVSQFLKRSLDEPTKQAIREGRIFPIFQDNLYYSEQVGLILCAADVQSFKNNLRTYGTQIIKDFEDRHFKRMAETMFAEAEQIGVEDYLSKNFGWKVRVQYDYNLAKESDDRNLVWLRRLEPVRDLVIYRYKSDSLALDEADFFALRDSLAYHLFDGDSIDHGDTYMVRGEFNGVPSLKLIGVWQNSKHLIGGPFRTYAFYHQPTGHTYLIDMTVTAPGKRKKPFLDQLETMARTFQVTATN
jgi:hypothetical protein